MPPLPGTTLAGRSPGRTPTLEALEDRTLLSGTPLLNLGGLTVNPTYAAADILVQFRPGTTPAPALAGTTLSGPLGLLPGLYEVQLPPGASVGAALAAYQADPLVQRAEPDYQLRTSMVPSDPLFGQQWALRNTGQDGGTAGADIHATGAWDVTQGDRPVVVAVMDSGIDYDHPDLYLNIWINQAEIPRSRLQNLVDVDHDGIISFRDLNNPINQGPGKITDVNHDGSIDAGDILAPMVRDAQGRDTGAGGWAYPGNTQDGDTAHPNDFIGWNSNANTNNPFDDYGHGTHVAGIIGATGDNGKGVAGVDWNVLLMPVKFLNADGFGSVGQFIAGLNYAVAHGAKISNNSWSGAGYSQILYDAIANARAHGQIFVAAAGNGGTNNDTAPSYPAAIALDNVVAVAATDHNDNLASFSNYGPSTGALAAPGENILSTVPGGGYAANSGTSMAAPFVTGALALVWGQHPTWSYTQVISQVLRTVDRLPALAGKTVTGGRLDLAAAVGAAATVSAAPRVVGAAWSGPQPGTLNAVRLTFDQGMNVATLTPGTIFLTGPGGRALAVSAVRVVSGSNNRSFDILFATQTTPGTYTLRVGPNVRDSRGSLMTPYQGSYVLANSQTFSASPNATIGPNNRAVSLLTIGSDIPIADINVRVNITFPYDGDLILHLQAPDGTDIMLAKYVGGSGQNFISTVFDDEAGTWILNGRAPFTGSYRPLVALSNLDGKNARGTWKLWVENISGSYHGTLNSWSLTILRGTAVKTASSAPLHSAGSSAPLHRTQPPEDVPFGSAVEMGMVSRILEEQKRRPA
jgi:subtilisin family serine protease/subtilisin-like proprotein convertase family protein